ncbi:hypothetical protein SPI_03954 [Niveomyces insectorum RCEF 264]|uniref:Uncharacterized protein n=1 Tax=Niveomyces insectorum RCEF 264 TaxID=1081102 RepID=A0A167VAX0_9HYPO|nr:hypothetical protein SPI_03954 [Niveomyces insectorum RCEF 264]
MASRLWSFFRSPRPAPAEANSPAISPSPSLSAGTPASSTSSPVPTQSNGVSSKKRQTSPPPSGRSAAAVAKRWRQLNTGAAEREAGTAAAGDEAERTNWTSRFSRLCVGRAESVDIKTEEAEDGSDEGLQAIPDGASNSSKHADTIFMKGPRGVAMTDESGDGSVDMIDGTGETEDEDEGNDGDDDDENEDEDEIYDFDDSGNYEPKSAGFLYPLPPALQGRTIDTRSAGFKAGSLNLDETDEVRAHAPRGTETERQPFVGSSYAQTPTGGGSAAQNDDEASREEEKTDDEELEDWLHLFEESDYDDDDEDSDWEVDEDERQAYTDGVAGIAGYAGWTADEQRLHRLLSLRGFHPLLPAAWTGDFLGVPMYPSLFAPSDSHKRVVIGHYASQFRATKALRALFDLQNRVTCLRQTGSTAGIGAVIERELRRYIAWAAADGGLARCAPVAAMPNIRAKQFPRDTHHLARRVQTYFRAWAARYRAHYAQLPAYVTVYEDATTATRGQQNAAPARRRLRPPRLLYGFVIVQHMVMLLVLDAAHPRARPRCFADFNMSLGDRWLDASLNVAIPVHLARAAQLRSIRGLVLPAIEKDETDVDA